MAAGTLRSWGRRPGSWSGAWCALAALAWCAVAALAWCAVAALCFCVSAPTWLQRRRLLSWLPRTGAHKRRGVLLVLVVVPGMLCLVFVYMCWLGGVAIMPGTRTRPVAAREGEGRERPLLQGAIAIALPAFKSTIFPVYNTPKLFHPASTHRR